MEPANQSPILKPVGLKEFVTIVQSIDDFWLSVVRLPSKQ